MAAFNLTAELNLRGPNNLSQVIGNIRRQLSTISLNLNINPSTSSGLRSITSDVRNLSVALRDAQTNAVALGAALRGLGANIGNLTSAANALSTINNNLANVGNNASASVSGIRAASSEMAEFGKQSALAIRRFAAFSVATGAVYALTRSITSAYGEFIKFNQEFVRLQQVTDSTAGGLKNLSGEITRLSTSLGVSSQELLNVSVTLAQAGLSAGETKTALEALAKSALAPSFDQLNDTVEGSIALMQQFGIRASGLEAALGSINAVAAKFAVEASDIITAIQRTGGVFASASKGVSEGTDALNEFISVFTSVRATTRESAETIATGLRTIFTRIQRGSTIDALREYGVELTDLQGKFVGPYEAVKRLSEGLKSLDPRDLRFSAIVEELGGFRQIGKVLPLIQQFTMAQQALGVAQRGVGSLTADAATAQESLANKMTKVREQFVGLIRDIGQSQGFQTFVDVSLKLASALISVADSAKNVLPALAAITAIKGVGALGQFFSGFSSGVTGRGRSTRGFATGGLVPGSGNGDTVPAMLTPGEFVIRKKAVESIGVQNLATMNSGGRVQKFAGGGRSTKGIMRGARSKFKDLSQEEIYGLSTQELIKYAKAQARNIFSTGGAGMATGHEFIEVPANRIIPELEADLVSYMGKRGFWREKIAPFGRLARKKPAAPSTMSREASLQKQVSQHADEVAARSQQWSSILSGSPIDNYLLKSLSDPILSDYRTVRGGGSLAKPFHQTRLRQAVNKALDTYDDFDYSSGNIDKLVSGMASKMFAFGGYVQRFTNGKGVKKVPFEDQITSGMVQGKTYHFGLVGLQSGTKSGIRDVIDIPDFTRGKSKKEGGDKKYIVKLHRSTFFPGIGSEDDKNRIESNIESSFAQIVTDTRDQLSAKLKSGKSPNASKMQAILKGSPLSSIIGTVFEAAIASLGSPFINKTEKTKSIDFPLGLGSVATEFGIPGNIPTDATRTIDGAGKGLYDMRGQIGRFIGAVENKEFTKAFVSKFNNINPTIQDNILNNIRSSPETSDQMVRRVNDALRRAGVKIAGVNVTVQQKQLKTAISRGTLGGLSDSVQGVLKRLYGKPIKLAASGGHISSEDTVPALLTPGEFVINKHAAQRIGSAELNRLNNADKIRGYNSGGFVQTFATGGSALPARPSNPTQYSVIVPDSSLVALREISRALEELGIQSSESAILLKRTGAISISEADRAHQADVQRLRLAGASATEIYNAEQRLARTRQDNARKLVVSQELRNVAPDRFQDIQTIAEQERQRLIENRRVAMRSQGMSNADIETALSADTTFQNDVRRTSYETAARGRLNTQRYTRLMNAGVTGNDIASYIEQSTMDNGTRRRMDARLKSASETALMATPAYGSATAQEQRRMLNELRRANNEEITIRRQVAKDLAKERGLSGFTGRAVGTGLALLGMGELREDAFGTGRGWLHDRLGMQSTGRRQRFARFLNGATNRAQQLSFGLTLASGMIGDVAGNTFGGGGANGKAVSSAVATGAGAIGVGAMFGPLGLLAGATVGVISAFKEYRKALIEGSIEEKQRQIDESSLRQSSILDKLSKSKDKGDITKNASDYLQELKVSAQTQRSVFLDKANSLRDENTNINWLAPWKGRTLLDTDTFMRQVGQEAISYTKQNGATKDSMTQLVNDLMSKGLSVNEIEKLGIPDEVKRSFALGTGDAKVANLERTLGTANDEAEKTRLNKEIQDRSNVVFKEFLQFFYDLESSNKALSEAAAAATVKVDLLSHSLTMISAAVNRADASFSESQRKKAIAVGGRLGGPLLMQGPDRSKENVLSNPLAYSPQEVSQTIGQVGSLYRFNPQLVQNAQSAASNQRIISEVLPPILKEIAARKPTAEDDPVLETLRSRLKEILATKGIAGDQATTLVKTLMDKLQNELKDGITVDQLIASDPTLSNITKNLDQQALKVFEEALRSANDRLAALADSTNELISVNQKASQIRTNAQNMGMEADINVMRALGMNVGLGRLNAPFENSILTLTQKIGDDLKGVAGTGTLDPNVIMQRMLEKEKEAKSLQEKLSEEKDPGSARYKQLQEQFQRAALEAQNLSEAHKKLAEDSSRAANVLEKIKERKQLEDNRKSAFLDFAGMIGNPDAMEQFQNEVGSYRHIMGGGTITRNDLFFNPNIINDARKGLERQLQVVGPEQGQILTNQFANQVGRVIAELDPANAGQNQQVIQAILENAGAGPRLSPEMQALVDSFYEATDINRVATMQQADIMLDAARQARDITIDGARQAANTVSAAGQNNPVVVQPANRSSGGLIYASTGKYIDFAPKGTDTIPAMLSPGEFVVNAKSAQKNLGLLHAINNNNKVSGYSRGGVVYLADGAPADQIEIEKERKRLEEIITKAKTNQSRYGSWHVLGGVRVFRSDLVAEGMTDEQAQRAYESLQPAIDEAEKNLAILNREHPPAPQSVPSPTIQQMVQSAFTAPVDNRGRPREESQGAMRQRLLRARRLQWIAQHPRLADSAFKKGRYDDLSPKEFDEVKAAIIASEDAWIAAHPKAKSAKNRILEDRRRRDPAVIQEIKNRAAAQREERKQTLLFGSPLDKQPTPAQQAQLDALTPEQINELAQKRSDKLRDDAKFKTGSDIAFRLGWRVARKGSNSYDGQYEGLEPGDRNDFEIRNLSDSDREALEAYQKIKINEAYQRDRDKYKAQRGLENARKMIENMVPDNSMFQTKSSNLQQRLQELKQKPKQAETKTSNKNPLILPDPNEPERRWIDSSSSSVMNGRLVDVRDNEVEILKRDGRRITVPLSSMSDFDRQYVTQSTPRIVAHRDAQNNRREVIQRGLSEGLESLSPFMWSSQNQFDLRQGSSLDDVQKMVNQKRDEAEADGLVPNFRFETTGTLTDAINGSDLWLKIKEQREEKERQLKLYREDPLAYAEEYPERVRLTPYGKLVDLTERMLAEAGEEGLMDPSERFRSGGVRHWLNMQSGMIDENTTPEEMKKIAEDAIKTERRFVKDRAAEYIDRAKTEGQKAWYEFIPEGIMNKATEDTRNNSNLSWLSGRIHSGERRFFNMLYGAGEIAIGDVMAAGGATAGLASAAFGLETDTHKETFGAGMGTMAWGGARIINAFAPEENVFEKAGHGWSPLAELEQRRAESMSDQPLFRFKIPFMENTEFVVPSTRDIYNFGTQARDFAVGELSTAGVGGILSKVPMPKPAFSIAKRMAGIVKQTTTKQGEILDVAGRALNRLGKGKGALRRSTASPLDALTPEMFDFKPIVVKPSKSPTLPTKGQGAIQNRSVITASKTIGNTTRKPSMTPAAQMEAELQRRLKAIDDHFSRLRKYREYDREVSRAAIEPPKLLPEESVSAQNNAAVSAQSSPKPVVESSPSAGTVAETTKPTTQIASSKPEPRSLLEKVNKGGGEPITIRPEPVTREITDASLRTPAKPTSAQPTNTKPTSAQSTNAQPTLSQATIRYQEAQATLRTLQEQLSINKLNFTLKPFIKQNSKAAQIARNLAKQIKEAKKAVNAAHKAQATELLNESIAQQAAQKTVTPQKVAGSSTITIPPEDVVSQTGIVSLHQQKILERITAKLRKQRDLEIAAPLNSTDTPAIINAKYEALLRAEVKRFRLEKAFLARLEAARKLEATDMVLSRGSVKTPTTKNKGGLIYASSGMLVPYEPRGEDTVPAMLTPGEFVVNRRSTKQNLGLLKAINNGQNVSPKLFNSGGFVSAGYYNAGGITDSPKSGSSRGLLGEVSLNTNGLDSIFATFGSSAEIIKGAASEMVQGMSGVKDLGDVLRSLGNIGLKEGASLLANAAQSITGSINTLTGSTSSFSSTAERLAQVLDGFKDVKINTVATVNVTGEINVIVQSDSGKTDYEQIKDSVIQHIGNKLLTLSNGALDLNKAP